MVIQIIQQLSLLFSLGSFAGNVIEEHRKGTYPQLIHTFKLLQQQVTVFFIPFDVLSRMNSPVKDYTIFISLVHQFLQLGSLLCRIRLAPVRSAVIRIILRTIQIDIHLVASVEFQLTETGFMTPGSTIKAFYNSTIRHIGIVGHFCQRQLAQCHQLCQRLHTIIGTTLIGTDNNDTVFLNA